MSYKYNPIPSLNQWVTTSPAKPTREEMRFDAAKAAMSALIGAAMRPTWTPPADRGIPSLAKDAVAFADSLLAELANVEGDTGNDEKPAPPADPPEGFEFTGEHRPPRKGEWYKAKHMMVQASYDYHAPARHILRKLDDTRNDEKPKPDPVVEELVEAAQDVANWMASNKSPWCGERHARLVCAIEAYREARR